MDSDDGPPVRVIADPVWLFRQACVFVKGVVNAAGLPDAPMAEVAFAGRSNVGKSSLLNALIGQKALARISNTPGRTRELNYFRLADMLHIVDMPGYGYARASKSMVAGWQRLVYDYLGGRTQLRRIFLLIDSRHGIKANDREAMKLMDRSAVSYQIVLTKLDKLKAFEIDKIYAETLAEIGKHAAAYPEIIATSAEKGTGIEELRRAVAIAAA
ncbi:MAG: ribosome biogenesis GTP-binding protein YihA/YsxC [Hyphomicrobiales bacterium]|nr:ribosome biogenesis GTP-binding protein YihA/YsxC [Hyphomicrobiales bacterium]